MIPERFVTEYPERCGQLLDMLERPARVPTCLGRLRFLSRLPHSQFPLPA